MELVNSDFSELLWQGILATSIWEWLAVATSVIYVILAAKRMILCWTFALISSALYVYICFISRLYIESMLQVFYFGMGILGWVLWNESEKGTGEIKTWGISNNLLNILFSGLLTISLGLIFQKFTDQASPFTDAFVTSFSLTATYMITKKIHEGWIYLIIIDIISIFLYASRDLYLSSFLYIMFTIIAVFGWWSWFRKFMKSSLLEEG